MNFNQQRLQALQSFKLDPTHFSFDGNSTQSQSDKFTSAQEWMQNFERHLLASPDPSFSQGHLEDFAEHSTSLTSDDVDQLFIGTARPVQKPTNDEIVAFAGTLSSKRAPRQNCANTTQAAGAFLNNQSVSSNSLSKSTAQSNNPSSRVVVNDSSPPNKVRKTSSDPNPSSQHTSTSYSVADIALRQIDEEKDRLNQARDDIAKSNKLPGKPDFEHGYMSAAQLNHLNELNNKPNQIQKKSRGLGLSKNGDTPYAPNGLSTAAPQNIQKEEKPQDDDKHPLLDAIEPEIIEKIKKEIAVCTDSISFDDVAGLQEAKKMIYEAVVLPLQRPDLFEGLRSAPKGILLFGPPGTGKTMIGKCIARQANATFFCISSAALTSKWLGEGEKLVRALFLYARVKQPSVIFIDEIDSILTKRSENECDSTRRMKTEFLVQLEGATSKKEDNVLLIGATNLPQEIDEAAKRRFTRRLYIPLPDYDARRQLLTILLRQNENEIGDDELDFIANAIEGYSGSDIKNLCIDAAMQPMRDIPVEELMKRRGQSLRPIQLRDFEKSMKCVKATVSKETLDSYIKWNEAFGST